MSYTLQFFVPNTPAAASFADGSNRMALIDAAMPVPPNAVIPASAAVPTLSNGDAGASERMPRQVRAFQCFKAGTQTDAGGLTKTYTDACLKRMADDYNASAAPRAPLQVGHDHAAVPVGTVLGLVAYGPALYAVAQVQAQVIEAARASRYTGVSMSLLLHDDGGYTLRHIALLDKQNPAVKGMAVVDFSGVRDAPALHFSQWQAQRYELTTAALDMQAASGLPFIEAAISIQNLMEQTA
jgi:hypothetical protein